MPGRKRTIIGIGIFFLILPALFWLLEDLAWFRQLRIALQSKAVPTGILNYGEMGAILKELGYVQLVDNDNGRFPRTDDDLDEDQRRLELLPFQKKRHVDEYLYLANPAGRYGLLRQFFPGGLTAKGHWPVLAIRLPEEDLHDPAKGLLMHRDQKGRQWERKTEVLVVRDGEAVFYSSAGLRIHGGKRRLSQYLSDYRLYFRKQIGIEAVPTGTLSDQEMPVRTLVVKNVDWPAGQPMNTPLAFDIAERIGCIVPETSLVELYINGKSIGMAYVTEHLSRRQWNQRFSHQDYVFFKFKGDFLASDEKHYHEKFWPVTTARQDFTMERVAKTIDLDNFSRHVFSWAFNGTTDACQGVGILDPKDPESRLRWINWDMDHSFYDLKAETQDLDRPNWMQEGVGLINDPDGSCDRQVLFTRLVRESEQYRRYFSALVTEILNHRLTEEFLLERVGYYRRMLHEFGRPHREYIAMLGDFVHHRADYLRSEMVKQFQLDGPFSCRVPVAAGLPLLIDGYTYETMYTGRYFKGQKIVLEPAGSVVNIFSHWLVDGKSVPGSRLELPIEDDVNIEAIFNDR